MLIILQTLCIQVALESMLPVEWGSKEWSSKKPSCSLNNWLSMSMVNHYLGRCWKGSMVSSLMCPNPIPLDWPHINEHCQRCSVFLWDDSIQWFRSLVGMMAPKEKPALKNVGNFFRVIGFKNPRSSVRGDPSCFSEQHCQRKNEVEQMSE